MKKIISLALAMMLVVCMVFALTSCSGISNGTYLVVGDDGLEGASIVVNGDKMTMKYEQTIYTYTVAVAVTVTYEINEDKIIATYDNCEITADGLPDTIKNQIISGVESGYTEPVESSFEKTENGFKIEGVEYVKQ